MLVMRWGSALISGGLIALGWLLSTTCVASAQAAQQPAPVEVQAQQTPPPQVVVVAPYAIPEPQRVGVGPQVVTTTPTPTTTPTTVPALAEPAPLVAGPWYGWQLLLSDLASLGVGYVVADQANARGDTRFGDAVGSAWGLGMISATAIHGAHGQRGHALSSLGARLLIPPAGSLVGVVGACLGESDHCSRSGARYGFALGLTGAAVLDALTIGYEVEHRNSGEWYGWQTLTVDTGLLVAGIVTVTQADGLSRSETGVTVAAVPWVLGFMIAPLIHGAHGRWGTGLASFGLRALGSGFATLFGLTGYCAATGGAAGCIDTGASYGLLGGTLIIAAIDATLMSYDDLPTPASASVMPFIAPDRNSLTFGFSGAL